MDRRSCTRVRWCRTSPATRSRRCSCSRRQWAACSLIACVNVSNLCLARGVARQRELTFRAALGAGRGRLARQLLTESLLLSAAGGALGLACAAALIRLTIALAPIRLPRLEAVRLDASVMAFTAAVSIVAAVLSGWIPSFRGTRFGLAESLRGGDGATAGGFRGRAGARVRDALLAAEAAFTVMLLVGALLLARSFVRLTQVDAGYTADRVLTARLLMPREADDQRIRSRSSRRCSPVSRAARVSSRPAPAR